MFLARTLSLARSTRIRAPAAHLLAARRLPAEEAREGRLSNGHAPATTWRRRCNAVTGHAADLARENSSPSAADPVNPFAANANRDAAGPRRYICWPLDPPG
jgi:hypothetical protein